MNKHNPIWYNKSFDQYPDIGSELDARDKIINEGFPIPKISKSKSSINHDSAVINNSFDEESVKESLFNIYNNSYYKLMANNNDNVHFYKWEGHMMDLTIDYNSNRCTFTLPWDIFIYPGERDNFKLSNYYNKWIKIQDILNNWDIFKWNIMVFINQRVYSEYEIYIQEQEVLIRFDYNNVWIRNNYPVYIYKFDTNFQKRILISKELLYNQWKWQIPYSYIGDMKIKNNPKIMASINKISDLSIRTDNNTHVEVLGDNLEFLTIDPNKNSVDLSTISQINVEYINSEPSQYIWLSLFVPKFMHEYPKFLVTDVLFRPYLPRLRPLSILDQSIVKHSKSEVEEHYVTSNENIRQLYIDENPNAFQNYDGWVNIIRPIVLSDAYTDHIEPYDIIKPEIDNFKISISIFADSISNFKFYVINDNNKNEENWNRWLDLIKTHGTDMYDVQYNFLNKRLSPQDRETTKSWEMFLNHIQLMRDDGWTNNYVPYNFYTNCNFLIQQCIKLTDKFHISDVVRSITKKLLWNSPDAYKGKVRFQRPIDVSDFWCFEYNIVDSVWRPRAREITQHFPDVYFVNPLEGESINPNGVYKAFFFYSDNINPRDLTGDIIESSPIYDEELIQYENRRGSYHDIFMEKFYWMAINSIYKGLLLTNSKWEVLEYVSNNPSYVRFNNLFINTMEPYYKFGLATYLKGDDNGFPFDYIVNKMKEVMKLKWNDYDRITNFETYLHNQWTPSYFDYITKILDDTNLSNRVVKRPPLVFNINLLKHYVESIQDESIISSITPLIDKCIDDKEIYSLKILNQIKSILMDAALNSNNIIIDNIINYIELANMPYTPNINLTSFNTIYEVDNINIISGGIGYKTNDNSYIPNIGVYKIDGVNNTSVDEMILDDSFYCKTFSPPIIGNIYLGRDINGIGMSIEVVSISSSHIRLDDVITPISEFISELLNALKLTSMNANPLENSVIGRLISRISHVSDKWIKIRDSFENNIDENNIIIMNDIIDSLNDLYIYGTNLMEIRDRVGSREILRKFNVLIETVKQNKYDENWYNPAIFPLEIKSNKIYRDLYDFYTMGSSWKDITILSNLIISVSECISGYFDIISNTDDSDAKNTVLDIINDVSIDITSNKYAIDEYVDYTSTFQSIYDRFVSAINSLTLINNNYYTIYETSVSSTGNDYEIGEIIYINTGNTKLCFQITSIDKYGVASVKPLLDYALNENIWGVFNTISVEGNGDGLKLDIKTRLAKPDLLVDLENYYIDKPNQYDDGDLISFKFPNIYDIDLTYEVFVGGKQITDFYQRHEDDHYMKARKVDTIYINANKINNLKNSSIYVSGDQYFIYRMNSIEIRDPGAGYHDGQEIYVDLNQFYLKLMVSKIMTDPFKGIGEINLIDNGLIYERHNPSGENLLVAMDTQNNIDDEFHVSKYDMIPSSGNIKPITPEYPDITYSESRYDNLPYDDRNETFMYPDVSMIDPLPDPPCDNGDPDTNLYQGSRIDNSIAGNTSDRWNSIVDVIELTDPFIDDTKRIPPGQPVKGEYQLIKTVLFHRSENIINADFSVPTFADRPASAVDFTAAAIGKTVVVESDKTNDDHRVIYTIIAITRIGEIIYNDGINSDCEWNTIDIDWMNHDWYPSTPNIRQQYPDAPWMTSHTFDQIQRGINGGRWDRINEPKMINKTTYIHNMVASDISVFNWTTKQWEDITDNSKWRLDVHSNDRWGFTLTYLLNGIYAHEMRLYLNKTPDAQMRNNSLLRNAKIDIYSSIVDEIDIPPAKLNVNTGRIVRIRKLFPYKQIESYEISEDNKQDGMVFKLAQYMHFRNEMHLEDIKLFNRETNLFEDILDTNRFEIQYRNVTYRKKKDEVIEANDIRVVDENNVPFNSDDVKVISDELDNDLYELRVINNNDGIVMDGTETHTILTSSSITYPGYGYYTGSAWAYNSDHNIQIFCNITVNSDGQIESFKHRHIPILPKEGNYEFIIYQHDYIGTNSAARLYTEFRTNNVEVYDDSWIHNVTNRMAVPPTGEFRIIPKFTIHGTPLKYDIIINKNSYTWRFQDDKWLSNPIIKIPNHQIPHSRLYALFNGYRLPMLNCSTGRPTLDVKETIDGMDITFMNMYRRGEQLEIRTLPYPTRSVYIQRHIPKHGYINLEGKLNKPLDKKYFEFWVNGKLLYDEVTIITPTKVFLHGLTSLKNLEILEINRGQDEYFSDEFLEVGHNDLRPYPKWKYNTYLDDVLKGVLEDDNYSLDEQEKLLTPIWKQVQRDHPEYVNYPENVDVDRDILLRIYIPEDLPLPSDIDISYDTIVLNAPTLEGIPLIGRDMRWDQFKWKPMDDIMLIDMMNEEWKHEISTNPYLNPHVIIDKDEWYGVTTRLYDKYGILTHNLDEALYKVYDPNIISINDKKKNINIIKNVIEVNLD